MTDTQHAPATAVELDHMQPDTCGLVDGSLRILWAVSGNLRVVYAEWTMVRRETPGWTYTLGQQQFWMAVHTTT